MVLRRTNCNRNDFYWKCLLKVIQTIYQKGRKKQVGEITYASHSISRKWSNEALTGRAVTWRCAVGIRQQSHETATIDKSSRPNAILESYVPLHFRLHNYVVLLCTNEGQLEGNEEGSYCCCWRAEERRILLILLGKTSRDFTAFIIPPLRQLLVSKSQWNAHPRYS